MRKYGSRKFLMALGSMASTFVLALTGNIDPGQAASTVATIAIGYIGVEGLIDAGSVVRLVREVIASAQAARKARA